MKNIIILFVALCLSSCVVESFEGEKEFLAPFFEDLENPDNFEVMESLFLDEVKLKHIDKGYTIEAETDICPGYTIRCNGEQLYQYNCGLSPSYTVRFAKKIVEIGEGINIERKIERLNCHDVH